MNSGRENKLICLLGIIVFVQLFRLNLYSQEFQLSIGTDIPYQFYVGLAYDINDFELSYRSGILVSPYSDAILSITE